MTELLKILSAEYPDVYMSLAADHPELFPKVDGRTFKIDASVISAKRAALKNQWKGAGRYC